MKASLALSILGEIMGWDDATCREQFSWLQLMAAHKFDRYRGFQPGVRFLESLVGWLQQFRPEHRDAAYDFIRTKLLYISSDEMSHLVARIYPREIQPRLVEEVASMLDVPPFAVWRHPDATDAYRTLLRQCLFLGLSDGARVDEFRRVNEGVVSNEQVTTTVQLDKEKWIDLLKNLRRDLGDEGAKFRFVFLLDDFVASGTTFLRLEEEKLKGKLIKFLSSVNEVAPQLVTDDWVVRVVHYLASYDARNILTSRAYELRDRLEPSLERLEFGFGLVLPDNFKLRTPDHPFIEILPDYYDPAIETVHTGKDIWMGFKDCAIPLVLEHNTPNNSVALLWAESDGQNGAHAMRPLFRRRQRHS